MSQRWILLVLLLGCCKQPPKPADAGAVLTARTLGLAYLDENRLDEAEAEFKKLIRLAPDEAAGPANLGVVYLRLGRYPDATRSIDRAVALAPDDPDIRLLQATALRLSGKGAEGRQVLEASLRKSPRHLKTLYALEAWDRLVEAAPANVAARLPYIEALLDSGRTTQARDQLELLRQRLPQLPTQARASFALALTAVQANRATEARAALTRARGFLETTPVYQASMAELRGPSGAPPGYPVLTFNTRLALEQHDPRAVVNAIRFAEVTTAGLEATAHDSQTYIALGDFTGDLNLDLLEVWPGGTRLYRNDVGRFTEITAKAGITGLRGRNAVAIGDYDNDGHVDLFAGGALFHNQGDGTFTRSNAINDTTGAVALFADLDHDGDLDLFVGGRAYRNNGDGSFKLQPLAAGAAHVVYGDFDGDPRIDLVVETNGALTLYRGLEEGRFEAHALPIHAQAIAAGDYDSDGSLVLFARGLYHNDGSGNFTRADGTRADVFDVQFVDFDNDGWLDLITAGRSGLSLLHNDERGKFTDRSALLPAELRGAPARQVLSLDFDGDGDLDVLVVGFDGRVHLVRNDGGNANQYVKVGLVALRDGSGKNNTFGIGSRLELRAGDLYQLRTVDQPVMHLGLGSHLKADVLRVVWTNGVPQSFYYPVSQSMLEEQVLKGSCTFLYTWDGEAYRFLTDVTWASALGMPLGIMAGEKTVYGPPQAAVEYFKIPGDRLKPVNGRYRMQLTEELWEVAYVDQLELVAVDHPEGVDVFVDESFVPPGAPGAGRLAIRQVRDKRLPVSATDERGRNLLPLLRGRDDQYVGGFTPAAYQGVTEPHDLVLDFGPLPQSETRLYLQGWLFPTDASINAAVAQGNAVSIMRPLVQVRDGAGNWRTVATLTFPAGKDKSMIVDMSGKWLSRDSHVRIRTNMEIYWDHVFLSLGTDAAPLTVTRLAPVAADLHARGWSRVYRKGGRYGPFWFDYSQVSTQSPWLTVGGRFTRYGDVLPLLGKPDDQTAILASGDEMSLEFAERDAPPLPAGWTRDFLLYNVAWMKDADLHTAAGQTVEPLPFHALSHYPYGAEVRYPGDAAHRRYVAEYNTRIARP
jgi:tetratricopeptide (TPR) repeat protein